MSLADILRKPVEFAPGAVAISKDLQAACRAIVERWPEIVPEPEEKDRERIVAIVKEKFESDHWADTKMSLVASAAAVLFDKERRERDDLADLREFFLREIGASTSATFLGTMFQVYLRSYVPGAAHTKALASALADVQELLTGRAVAVLNAFPDILDPRLAHAGIAARMKAMQDPWSELKSLGIRTPHAPGIMDHAHEEFVRGIAPDLHLRESMETLFRWLKPDGQNAREVGGDIAVNAVLAPWRDRQPANDVKRLITETLVSFYDDPRARSGGIWSGVDQGLLDIFLEWITEENIRFFMDVVSAVEENHMWEERREFWLGLHSKKKINSAWVAFSESGVNYAKKKLTERGSRESIKYGRQIRKGARGNTSILIMKIGNKIFVEGSHDYRIHVFRDLEVAPRLFLDNYDCDVIMNESDRLRDSALARGGRPGAESRKHRGAWQDWVLQRI